MMESLKDIMERHLYGILGSVVFHLIIVLIFMSIKVASTYRERSDMIIFDFTSAEEEPVEELPEQTVRQKLTPDEIFWRNIAVNQARAAKEDFDLEEFIDRLREELLREGTIRPENWEDNGTLRDNLAEMENSMLLENENNEDKAEDESSLADLANAYDGPTNIYYTLENRNAVYLPLPIYKCREGGKVVVRISVDQQGLVVQTAIDPVETESQDLCLHDAARETAARSRFSISTDAPSRQQGTISYHFQPQKRY